VATWQQYGTVRIVRAREQVERMVATNGAPSQLIGMPEYRGGEEENQ